MVRSVYQLVFKLFSLNCASNQFFCYQREDNVKFTLWCEWQSCVWYNIYISCTHDYCVMHTMNNRIVRQNQTEFSFSMTFRSAIYSRKLGRVDFLCQTRNPSHHPPYFSFYKLIKLAPSPEYLKAIVHTCIYAYCQSTNFCYTRKRIFSPLNSSHQTKHQQNVLFSWPFEW